MNTAARIGIVLLLNLVVTVSVSLYGQSYNRAVVLRNLQADTIALYPPADHLTSHSLTLPRNPPGSGGIFYAVDGIGSTEWLSAGANNDILQTISGLPSWQNPNTALDDNFVRYNIAGTQSLASTTAGNFLFNIEYGTTNAAAAAGARIHSLTSLANSNATGLSLNATATGAGTSRGLVVTTSGGANNYTAIFTGGNVGIGTPIPTSTLDIERTTSNSSGVVNTSEIDQTFTIPNSVNSFDNHSVQTTLTGTLSAASSGGTMTGLRSNAYLLGVSGSVVAADGLAGVLTVGGSSTISGYGVGVEGSVGFTSSSNIVSLSCLAATSGLGTPLIGIGTITDWNGIRIGNPSGTSTITNLTGVRIDPLTYASATSTNAILYNHATAPFVVKGSGNVGIGVLAPSPRLHVQADTVKATSSTFGGTWFPNMAVRSLQYINPSSAPATSFFTIGVSNETRIVGSTDMSNTEILGTFALNRNENTNTVHSMRTIQANLNQAATGTVDTAVSVFSDAILSGSGNIGRLSNFRGLMNTLTASGTGTITNAVNLDLHGIIRAPGDITNYYGLYFETPGRQSGETGTFTNVTAIHIKDIPSTVYLTGTRRAFYYDGIGSDDPVIITGDGRVGIGDNSTTPATSLDLDGGMVVRPPTTINVGAAVNIAVGNRSYIRVNPTASVNVGLAVGNAVGQVLIVEVIDNGVNQLTFVDAAAQNLALQGAATNFTVANSATFMFVWNGSIWMELSRREPD